MCRPRWGRWTVGSPNQRVLQSSIPVPGITRRQGIITGTATALTLNVDGNTIPYRCVDPLVVGVGDTVAVDLVAGPTGQAEAWVIGRLASTFRPSTGKVKTVPPSSPSITVTGTDGVDYTAYFITSYTPVVNDNVDLSWGASIPFVMGKVGTTAAPPPPAAPVAPPPGPSASGTSYYPATDSGTWVPAFGSWDSWAGGGGNVYQGQFGSGQLYGAWFYGGSPMELAGRTITRVQFTLGSRRTVGSYNQSVAVHLYAHTNTNRPGGDVNRVAGPVDSITYPFAGQTVFDLPVSTFAGPIIAGGGVAIALDPYAGFNGRYTEPASGRLQIDWSR